MLTYSDALRLVFVSGRPFGLVHLALDVVGELKLNGEEPAIVVLFVCYLTEFDLLVERHFIEFV